MGGPERALVVGGAGFIGSHLVERLLLDGIAVEVVDDLSTGSLAHLADARAMGASLKIHHLSAADDDFVGLVSLRRPDVVYHPYTYNARTFRAGGPEEDSTLEPPQHPIATLGPIWRDIWFNGGPYAMVYRTGAELGVGFAAVRGSEWEVAEGVRGR